MIYNARVITGFQRPEKNHSEITVHVKPIHIGSLFGSDLSCIDVVADSVSKGGIPCVVSKSVDKDLWAKMLFNMIKLMEHNYKKKPINNAVYRLCKLN